MKPKKHQLGVLAALLGVSNIGQDNIFLAKQPEWTPEKITREYERGKNTAFGPRVDTESWAIAFWGHYAESDEMMDMCADECRSWNKHLRKMTFEEMRKTWKRYAEFFTAVEGWQP